MVDEHTADELLAKCARHCAICRRFRPLKLQVHHIVQQSKGGSDDPDNLIPICISCHSDVHAHVPFALRFTEGELKLHKAALFLLLQEGKLPFDNSENTPLPDIRASTSYTPAGPITLDEIASSLLVRTAHSKDGCLFLNETVGGLTIKTSDHEVILDAFQPAREIAKHRHALNTLLDAGYLCQRSSNLTEITHEGFLAADDIESESSL